MAGVLFAIGLALEDEGKPIYDSLIEEPAVVFC
jgi:hypothetical protein